MVFAPVDGSLIGSEIDMLGLCWSKLLIAGLLEQDSQEREIWLQNVTGIICVKGLSIWNVGNPKSMDLSKRQPLAKNGKEN